MKKKPRFRWRFKYPDDPDGRWHASAWETNSIVKAREHARRADADPLGQVWDYKNKKPVVDRRVSEDRRHRKTDRRLDDD